MYRYNRDSGSWSLNSGSGNGWQPVDKPEPKLQNQQQLRNKGAQRTRNFDSMRGFGGARMRAGSSDVSYGLGSSAQPFMIRNGLEKLLAIAERLGRRSTNTPRKGRHYSDPIPSR